MNKSTMIAAIFAASAFSAFAADVYSSNIVGYSKVDLVPGFTMVGVPFQAVGATGTINIQDLVDTTGLVGYDWGTGTGGDTLVIWDPLTQSYANEYTWSGPDGPAGFQSVWLDMVVGGVADVEIDVASAYFINSATPTNFVGSLVGEVAAVTAGDNVAFVTGFTMIANPFPYVLDINADMIPTGLVGYDWGTGTGGDTLVIWDSLTQSYATEYTWSGPDGPEGFQSVWLDMVAGAVADEQVPVGGAFFINTSGAGGTIDFAAP